MFLRLPFPRPKRNRKNIILLLLIALISNLFILIFRPFDIENQTGEWFIYLILFSLGIVFFFSVYFIEFLVPSIFPKPFKTWTLLKALLWYTFVIFFVGAVMFFYKSFLGGFVDFTWREYFFVLGRVLGISIIVSFFTLGIFSYFNRKKFSSLLANENYLITTSNSKSIKLNVKNIMYIVSDDNYVDIHLEIDGLRKKEVFRSSLKNIESQIVSSVSPIKRCHRRYLINIQYFKIDKMNSRNMSLVLNKYNDEVPVSKNYSKQIQELLHVRP